MPDNKDNITVSINIDPNSEEQLQKYTASFISLKIAIANLNKPINNTSMPNNI